MSVKGLLAILFFYSIQLFSQTESKTIILKDKDTDAPIEDVTVTLLKTKQNLLSNANGIVTFELTGSTNIQIKHSSYLPINLRSNTLKETVNTIYLTSNVNELEDIVITKKHPQKILASLIENSKKRLTVPGRLKVYCREFFKLNGKYSYFNDGLMNIQLLNKSRKTDAIILVEQNRSINLTNDFVKDDLLGYNLNDIMENYYNFKYLNPLLDAVAKKEYDFVIKVFSKNKDYNVISAVPNENASGLLDDFTIIYDPDKKLIIEVSSIVSPLVLSKIKEKTSLGSKNIYKSMFKTIYKLQNNNYYLIGSKEEIGFEKNEKNAKKDIEVRNYFLTKNFSTSYYKFKEEEVFKDKTLHNKKNVILTDYWNESGLTATEDEQQIINTIEEIH
ncbi:MAG TPA: hypothetical protein PK218_04345 [Flavobacterium sp.]|jgi:hypothetical protein|uniref:hypothetical protein n=1 Tax=Flavobacterium sp. TaxID=239 RepID=UPI002C201BC3|nr:hypothetical protein [Flavobacterium sp.]MCA0347676.1 hypothetical protein [Bacteroidota bacterium]HPW97768.1 hypothetical protein [Flavobacterium sp.]HQA73864.1 hypothetical protein [Flavobacterium sp.]